MRPFNLIFWAVLCVLAGCVLLVRQFSKSFTFNPITVIFGIFVLLLGVSMLTTPSGRWITVNAKPGDAIFGSTTVSMDDGGEHNCIFGQSTVDLTEAKPGTTYKVNCVFGQSNVKIPTGKNVKIVTSSAFGAVIGDSVGTTAFGTREEVFPGEGDEIRIEVNAVFGQATILK